MSRDLLFRTDDFIFSYRVAGILDRCGRVLLQKPSDDDGYAFIGGHVAAMERTQDTLRREFREEIHADVIVGDLMAVGEVFFPWGAKTCHQIALYYRVQLADETQIPLEGTFHGFDDLGGERLGLDFLWIEKEKLSGLTVYPPQVARMIERGEPGVLHFVYDQEGILGRAEE